MATAQATQDVELGFPPKGSLRRVAFPRLMREIGRKKLTGSLYLLNGQTKKVVFFDEGQPVFVRSNVLSECLGQILSSEGLITQEQCEQTLEAIRRTGKKQGELLVEMGILSEGNLRYGLEAQLRAKLYDIFGWEDGRYQFKNDPPNLQFGIRLERSAEAVIIGAVQDEIGEERAAAALAASLDKYLELCAPENLDLGDLELLAEERYFVECLDGSRTVAESVNGSVKPPLPTPNALVFALIQAGVAQVTEHGADRKPQPDPPNLHPTPPPDDELAPMFAVQDVVTEYEDTPLPGELPQVRRILGEHEADFSGVDDLESSSAPHEHPGSPRTETSVSQALVAAEPEAVEETFDDDQIELSEDEAEIAELHAELQTEPPLVEPVGEIDEPPFEDTDVHDFGPEPELIEPASSVESVPPVELSALDLETIVDGNTDADAEQPALLATQADALIGGRPPSKDGNGTSRPTTAAQPVPSDDLDLGDLDVDDDLLLGDDDDLIESEDLLDAEGAQLDDIDLDGVDLDDVDLDNLDLDGADFSTSAASLDAADGDGLDPQLDVDLDVDVVELSPDVAESVAGPIVQAADANSDLVDFDDLDAVDLGEEEGLDDGLDDGIDDDGIAHTGPEATFQEDENPEMAGAMRFNEAETALNGAEYRRAVGLLEVAYENGFDVAELHAMLAYARFMAAGQDYETAQHAFELLDYAENMDPSLDLVHAYRGAIYRGLGNADEARDALARALELNPYCELAMQLMDELG